MSMNADQLPLFMLQLLLILPALVFNRINTCIASVGCVFNHTYIIPVLLALGVFNCKRIYLYC